MGAKRVLFRYLAALLKVIFEVSQHLWDGKALIKLAITARYHSSEQVREVAHFERIISLVYLQRAQLYLVLRHGLVQVQDVVQVHQPRHGKAYREFLTLNPLQGAYGGRFGIHGTGYCGQLCGVLKAVSRTVNAEQSFV